MTPVNPPTEAQSAAIAAMRRRCAGTSRPHPNGGVIHSGSVTCWAEWEHGKILVCCSGDAGREAALIDPDGTVHPRETD